MEKVNDHVKEDQGINDNNLNQPCAICTVNKEIKELHEVILMWLPIREQRTPMWVLLLRIAYCGLVGSVTRYHLILRFYRIYYLNLIWKVVY